MWESAFTGAGSSLLSGAATLIGGMQANAANVAMAREQMAFQERMRDTAYQAAVKDLQKAGLNPMLAFSNGGAAVPSGAMGHVDNAMGPAVSNAMQTYQAHQAVESAKTAQDNVKADTVNKNAATANINQDTAKKAAETEVQIANATLSNAQTGLARQQLVESQSRQENYGASTAYTKSQTDYQRLQNANYDVFLDQLKAQTRNNLASAGQANAIMTNTQQNTLFNKYGEAGLRNDAEFEGSWGGDFRRWANAVGVGADSLSSARSALGRTKRGMTIQQNNINK